MLISTLLKIFVAQVILGAVIIFALKKLLDKQLFDLAVQDIKYWQSTEKLAARIALDEFDPSIDAPRKIIMVSYKPLGGRQQALLRQTAVKQFGDDVVFEFRVNKDLLGGVIVTVGDCVLDHSLKERLTHVFRNKKSCE